MPEDYRFIKSRGNGSGGFLNPPGHPTHTWRVEEYTSARKNAKCTGVYSLEGVVSSEWIPAPVRERAAKLLAETAVLESPLWVRQVYGYFRNMWTPDGTPWDNVSNLISGRPDGAPDDWHAAVVFVRKFFPAHEVRTDLIENPGKGYGSHPCEKCGQRVQYEEHLNALAVVTTSISGSGITQWKYDEVCPKGGPHVVTD